MDQTSKLESIKHQLTLTAFEGDPTAAGLLRLCAAQSDTGNMHTMTEEEG